MRGGIYHPPPHKGTPALRPSPNSVDNPVHNQFLVMQT
jgi:hypothetical protein